MRGEGWRSMKKLSALVVAIILLIVLALVIGISIIQFSLRSAKSSYDNPQTENAVNYLTNVMFVPSVGLDKEAPIAAPNTVWLTNDNLEVYAVLSELGNSRATTLNQSLTNYGVSENGLVELLLNKTIEPIRTPNSYTVATIGQYTIMEEVRNGSLMQDFAQYADLCFWWSKNLLLSNDIEDAIAYFNQGMSMWNGTGFLDKAFNTKPTEFETFKVGLALWMAEQLNQTTNGGLYLQTLFTDTDYSEMQNIIWSMQDPTNGGIHTGYTSTFGTAGSDTNVETTAICLLYQSVPSPTPTPTPTPTAIPEISQLSLLMVLIVGVLIVCASVIVLYKKRNPYPHKDASKGLRFEDSTLLFLLANT